MTSARRGTGLVAGAYNPSARAAEFRVTMLDLVLLSAPL